MLTSLSVLSAGSAYTWIEPLMDRLQQPGNHFFLTPSDISWIASLVEIGPLVTPIPVGFLVNRLGRKMVLLATAPIYAVSWILVLTTKSVPVLLIVRILQGMGIGIIMTTLPLYLGEIAEPKVRGSVGTFVQCMWYLGVIYVYSIGPFVSYETLTWACLAPSVLLVLSFVWFPESPYCLLLQNKEKKARESLAWFRGRSPEDDLPEIKEIKDSVSEELENKASWKDLVLSKSGRKGMFIIIVVGLTTYMSGLRTVQMYATDTFSTTANEQIDLDPHYVTIVMGVLTLIATMFSSVLVDRLGRRPLLLISSIGSTLVLALAALYFYLDFNTHVNTQPFSYTPYITVCLYSILMSLSSSIGFTLQAELFPSSTRGIASGATTFSTTIMCFVSLKLYDEFKTHIGLYFNYLVFALFAGGGSIVVYMMFPETKGKTFSEIQQMLL